jgi:hypothetical protein
MGKTRDIAEYPTMLSMLPTTNDLVLMSTVLRLRNANLDFRLGLWYDSCTIQVDTLSPDCPICQGDRITGQWVHSIVPRTK